MILGSYKIIKKIGEGGFARTYLGQHMILEEKACLKQNLNLNAEEEKRLLAEAKLLWGIHHYSLPTLRDFLRTDDGYVLVMSFVEGKDLYKIIQEDYPEGLHPEHVAWICQRLIYALNYLHYNGIIHGDIKPQNVMVLPDYGHQAVLVDYGLATVLPDKYTRAPGYTPAYAAPEQIEGKPPIPQTDLYGLGVTMIEALGGNPRAKTYPDSVPRKMQEFINQMVLRDPLSRPKSAESLIEPIKKLRQDLFGRISSNRRLEIS